MAGRHKIVCDQGSTLTRSFRVASLRALVRDVTNVVSPVVTTDVPHGLSAGDEVCVRGVLGAAGVNNAPHAPVWIVDSVPSPTSFVLALSAPGVFIAPESDKKAGTVSTPRDLTGYTGRMHVRTTVDAEDTVLEATSVNNRIAIGAPAGSAIPFEVALTVPASVTAAVPAAVYRYDLEIESGDGAVLRVVEGPFSVRAETTR